MSGRALAPYGAWASPISADSVARGGVSLSLPRVDGDVLYWLEGRPHEGGREVIVRRAADGSVADAMPRELNARTRVHEYGGGAYAIRGATVVLANFTDQRVYRVEGGDALPLTPAPAAPASHRYADFDFSPDGATVACVRERHESGRVTNDIVALTLDGSAPPRTLAEGRDFYATPRFSPDGRLLAWLAWDQPNMPWDGTELHVAAVGDAPRRSRVVTGGPEESIFQPAWSPAGVLHFVSDQTGWWNLYREEGGAIASLCPVEAELGLPHWVFGQTTYAFLPDGRIGCLVLRDGLRRLAVLDPGAGALREIAPEVTFAAYPIAIGRRLAAIVASASSPPAVALVDPDSGAVETVRSSLARPLDPAFVSAPRPFDFETTAGLRAHALHYAPANPEFTAPAGEQPPLLVLSHGGPTGQTSAALEPAVQFWTSRGFAVVDVNYGGSTGFGRAYRKRLDGAWGVVDVADCVNAALALAREGHADPHRLIIRGRSAGGYTTLCALAFTDVFAAGASYFGIADLEVLARDTHKFEARYLDRLVGPYPQAASVYRERSPVHAFQRLRAPLVIFQGLDDQVVPPSQAELMVEALRRNGVRHAYLTFAGEGHGFRKADTIARTLEAELSFYARIFGFTPADPIEPVKIEG